MRFGINLRGDLAKLSDSELASRLEQTWQAYDAVDNKPKRGNAKLWYSRRGPIRHPWAYRFLSVAGLSGRGGSYFGLGPFLRLDPTMDMHLIFCEIRDLTDEMERRVRHQKGISR